MTTTLRDMLRNSALQECRSIQHLYSKIPAGGMDYRPTEGQRTTLELLRYLATMAEASMTCILSGNWDDYSGIASRSLEMKADEFPQLMDQQIANLEGIFEKLTDEELMTRKARHVTGVEFSLAEGILELPLKWLTGYRMQLFLYAKQAGNTSIDTANNWLGVDSKPKD